MWIGITFKMGTLGRARAGHYWMNDDDFGNETIKSAMLKNRYNAITANLSFAPRGAAGGWDKIGWLDAVLMVQCMAAIGITSAFAIDESMIKCLSKYCPWLQYMPKKPIKRGERLLVTQHSNTHACTRAHARSLRVTSRIYEHSYIMISHMYMYMHAPQA